MSAPMRSVIAIVACVTALALVNYSIFGIERKLASGRIVAGLDADGIASYRRLDDGTPPAGGEVLLHYRVREGQIKFAGNSFFFQKGTAGRYMDARYAEFRVAPDGDLLLTGLRDRYFTPL